MQFQMAHLFNIKFLIKNLLFSKYKRELRSITGTILFPIEVPKNLLLSKYERQQRSITGTILFPIKIHPQCHAGTLFAYHDGNPLTIL